METYLYDDKGLFIGEHICQNSPRDNGYLKPKNSTEIKPNIQDGNIALWNYGEWEIKEDIRGIYYNTYTKEKVFINDINADLSNLTKEKPDDFKEWDGESWVLNLDKIKEKRIKEIDSRTQALIYDGIKHNDIVLSMSNEAQINYLSLQQDIDTLIFPFAFTTKDDGEYICQDIADMQNILIKAKQLKLSAITEGRALKLAIKVCNSIEELNGIVDER